MNLEPGCYPNYSKMIVVKEEQGSGEWVRNGGSDPEGLYGRPTMLKEEMPPNLPPDHPHHHPHPPNAPPHAMPHNNNGPHNQNNNNNSNNNNNNSPTLGNHNHPHHGSSGITGVVSSCANSGAGHHHHHHNPGQNNNNNNNSNCGGGVGSGGSGNNICSGCGQKILDRYYVLAVDRQWHNECLKCHSCQSVLSGHLTCFFREGVILCKEDYYRTYQQLPRRACARCGNGIGSHELIMRAKDLVYHLSCFVCVVCSRVLNKGDHFGMRNSSLYCQKHYEMVLDENSTSSPPPPHMTPNSPHQQHPAHHHTPPHHPSHHGSGFFNGAGSGQKGRPRKRKDPNVDGNMGSILELGATPPPAMQHLTQNLDLLGGETGSGHHLSGPRLEGYDSSSSTSCPTGVSGNQRTKRMRTSFKHHQLRTMKSYFAINQNPDAKDLKQLAQKTGLSKRVLQVWFQNARAKWRRNMLRTESSGTTPTRDDEMQMSAGSIASGALDILSGGGGSDDGGFSSDVY